MASTHPTNQMGAGCHFPLRLRGQLEDPAQEHQSSLGEAKKVPGYPPASGLLPTQGLHVTSYHLQSNLMGSEKMIMQGSWSWERRRWESVIPRKELARPAPFGSQEKWPFLFLVKPSLTPFPIPSCGPVPHIPHGPSKYPALLFVKNCGEIHITKFTILSTFKCTVQTMLIKFIVLQPSPPSISRMFSSCETETLPVKQLPILPSPNPWQLPLYFLSLWIWPL